MQNGDRQKEIFQNIQKSISDFLTDTLSQFLWLACVATLVFQGWGWLDKGKWQELPLFNLLELIPAFHSWGWVHQPESLLGLHSIVVFLLDIGLAFFFVVLSVVSLVVGSMLEVPKPFPQEDNLKD